MSISESNMQSILEKVFFFVISTPLIEKLFCRIIGKCYTRGIWGDNLRIIAQNTPHIALFTITYNKLILYYNYKNLNKHLSLYNYLIIQKRQ